MKKLFLITALAICLMVAGYAYAQEETVAVTVEEDKPDFSLKQGFVYSPVAQAIKNLTTLTIIRTKPIESWGKWNALIDGWTFDIGYAYDSTTTNNGAILIGREFGTLGKYLPIEFPLADKITITLYPAGIYLEDLFHNPKGSFCMGVGILKFDIKF